MQFSVNTQLSSDGNNFVGWQQFRHRLATISSSHGNNFVVGWQQ